MSVGRMTVIKPIAILLLVFQLTPSAHAIDFKKCVNPFRAVWQKIRASGSSQDARSHYDPALAAFNPSRLADAKVNPLSASRGVLQIDVGNGQSYVVRMSGLVANPEFENFAAEFMLKVPGLKTSPVRVLDADESARFTGWLKKTNRNIFHELVNHRIAEKLNPEHFEFTVSLFHNDLKSGHDYFLDQDLQNPLAEVLATFAENPHYRALPEDQRDNWAYDLLDREWDKLALRGSSRQIEFLDELKKVSNIPKDLTVDSFVNYVLKEWDHLGELGVANLYAAQLRKIPQPILAKLADYWAITSALGIRDFHWNNWGAQGSEVVAIDLAYRSREFVNGMALDSLAQHPLGKGAVPDTARRVLRENISEETKAYLRSLTEDKVRSIAAAAQFEITDQQVNGILLRVREVLDDK
jgi:hypothetical protein